MLVFPSNPNAGDVFAPGPGLPSWIWDGDKWTRGGAAAQFALEALADVAISAPAQGEMLAWDATAEKWVNAPVPEVNLTDYATQQYVHDQIAAIPPPPIPSLVGLSDTNVPNPSVGQALTFNGSTWSASNIFSEPVKVRAIDGGGGVDAFAVTNSAQTEKYFWVRSDGANYLRSPTSCYDPYGGPIWETLPGYQRASFQVYSSQNESGIRIAQNVPNSSYAADWLFKVIGNTESPSGTSYGMYMRAGNSTATGGGDTALLVSNLQDETIFQLVGDGQVRLGPQYNNTSHAPWVRAPMILDWLGNMTLGWPNAQPTNPARARFQARDAQTALWCDNAGAEWCVRIQNSNTAGNSYGLMIQAGLQSNDYGLYIARGTGTLQFGQRGDGALVCPPMINFRFAGGVTYLVATDPGGQFGFWSSSGRYKESVCTVQRERAREIVAKLRPVTYRANSLCVDAGSPGCGLIAEEVARLDPTLVAYDKDGEPSSVQYHSIAMLMLPLLRELLGIAEPEESLC